jgi:hypothetical protein
MKKIALLVSLIVVSCGSDRVNMKELEGDADRLCAIVQSTPKFQAKEEYVKGYYKILDRYNLSQESIFIHETFDNMESALFLTSLCKIQTLGILKYAVEKTDYQTVQKRLDEIRSIAKEQEMKELREDAIKKREEAKVVKEFRESLAPIGEVISNDSIRNKLGFTVVYFDDYGDGDIVIAVPISDQDDLYLPIDIGGKRNGFTLESATGEYAVFTDEDGKKYVLAK